MKTLRATSADVLHKRRRLSGFLLRKPLFRSLLT